MSSPSRKPENAASAAPVSSQGVAAGSSSASPVSAAAAAATGTAIHSPSSDSLDLTGSSSISDHAWPSASVSPAVPAPVPVPPGSHVPSTSTPQSSAALNHVDQSNKKSRPPTAPQRPNGPSLLTQALASARGILHSHVPISNTDQRRPEQKPVPVPVPPNGTNRPSQPKNLYEPHTGHTVTGPQNAFYEHNEQGDLTPTGYLQFTEAARTISAPSLSSITYPGVDGPPPLPVTMPATISTTSTFLERRDFEFGIRSRGRSLERTEKELRLRLSNLPNAHSDNVGDTLYSSDITAAKMAPSTDDNPEQLSDARVQYRAWRVERPPISMGPEKAWSIGTNDIIGHQDGQVEKSITEVLAGVEPTRSRKASHSLRFFKEGLPEEKGRRRESKSGGHQREKQLLSKGLQLDLLRENQLDENAVFQNLTPSPQSIEGEQSPSRLSSVQSFPWGTADLESIPPKAVQLDYFGLQKPSKHSADPIKTVSPREQLANAGIYSEPNGSAVVSDEDVTQIGRESSDVTEVGEPTEEGDESSEEKISSAVFLPHQGLEQSPENGCIIPEEFKVSQSTSRKPHSEDFHPWLVKADEPEADVGARAEGPDSGNVDRKNDTALYVEECPRIDDECAIEDEVEFPQKSSDISARSSRPVSQYYEDMVHDHQLGPKMPLDAIELIPYKHQVGGHTTIWRFSKRAVCKQLNNRENEFYEKIERYHRDLLPFLPRYIGVLNVTFQKQPRRKSTIRKDDSYTSEKKGREQDSQVNGNNGVSLGLPQVFDISDKEDQRHHRRIVSQSLQSSHTPIPTVTFVDNRHILPRSLLRPTVSVSGDNRPWSASAAVNPQFLRDHSTQTSSEDTAVSNRPVLEDRHANSWGATTVNKRLRNEVFNDAFLKQPIAVHKHRRPASQQRSIPRRPVQQPNRPTSSESALLDRKMVDDSERQAYESSFLKAPPRLLQSHSDLSTDSSCLRLEGLDHVKDVTGTSAPEPEILSEKFPHQNRRRRNSGSKLRRRPQDVTESRGNLKYFEDLDEVEYKRDNESHTGLHTLVHVENGHKQDAEVVENGFVDNPIPQSYFSSTVPSELPSPTTEFKKISRPVNPKEAQTQRDSRVEYFLLLEDLTAGMKRPCIMDLKMGTRQYGVEAGPGKRESQQRKCAVTTSRDHGVRVCGLQSWDAKSQTYIFKDKYYGRNLKAGSEFQDALTMFLYDGVDYTSVLRHIPTILQKLNQLEMTIRRLRGYRFYAASLLMFYDADDSDEGYDTAADDSTTDFATDAEDAWEARKRRRNKKEIDFKMADFANSVTAGDLAEDKPCPPKYPDEPDRGFLRGLATLRKYFLKIQKDVRNELGLIPPRRQEDDGSEVERSEEGWGSVSD
ncbi:SAICAR synthase-like protein [Annulohypoxylon maeteangense]|uniref:SAICAR synthase-like protein n=1 Tax=Annulohypoxylon maeteangense TaxID=1927788 RepID=UPI002007E98B|nr:SAICAR synthase-like protein [Annulohypoxylon maeteangense]KAI0884648.1 SAICAR synthase-like protein [Annulohypoxylon maeteangense]